MDKAINKKDYLKKYIAGSDKKKKKRTVVTSSSSYKKSRIVDDDIDLNNIRPLEDDEIDIYNLGEDAPQIAGVVDERPDDVKVMSQYRETKKWKVVTTEYEDVKVSSIGGDSDLSPHRHRPSRKDSSDSDISVERPKKKHSNKYSDDASPPRRALEKQKSRGSDGDLSPPRKKRSKQKSDSDISPPRKDKKLSRGSKHRHNDDNDLSPPRMKSLRKDNRDHSPPRRKVPDNDRRSPHRKTVGGLSERGKIHDQRDIHSSRRDNNRDDRANDRERIARDKENDQRRKRDDRSEVRHQPSKKTLDGKKAGLQNAADMKIEAEELRRRQAENLAKLGEEVSGKGAAAVMRDKKTGKRRDLNEEARSKREENAKKAEIVEQYAVWGKGVKQIEDRTRKMKDDKHEMSKPVARYADDADLEDMLKNEEKEGDPMLEYIRNKKKKEKKAGTVKQMYEGQFLPNRYGIRPGHRWDGVDRSNGYEKKLFDERSNRKAIEEEAFKWSTEDM